MSNIQIGVFYLAIIQILIGGDNGKLLKSCMSYRENCFSFLLKYYSEGGGIFFI